MGNIADIERWLSRSVDESVEEVLNDWGSYVTNQASNKAIQSVKNDFRYRVVKEGNKFVLSLYNTNLLAVYSEFGTGGQVFNTSAYGFTPEDKAYAYNFFINGQGKMKPTPALYPSVFENTQRLAVELATEINKAFR